MYKFTQAKRNTFNAMVSVVDSSVKNVTDALKTAGMWSNTLFVWTTGKCRGNPHHNMISRNISERWRVCLSIDNGSPCQVSGSNDPLRGNKGSDWEGGSRTPTFVTGGMIPAAMAGRKLSGIVGVWDWCAHSQPTSHPVKPYVLCCVHTHVQSHHGAEQFQGQFSIISDESIGPVPVLPVLSCRFATIATLAGVTPKEPNPASPSPVDSFDVFPYLTGAATASPRTELVYDHLQFDVTTTACVYRGNIQVLRVAI